MTDTSFSDILPVGGSGMKRSNYATGTADSMFWSYKALLPMLLDREAVQKCPRLVKATSTRFSS
jgi:hypothetical protein